ncbi:hypothetical protein Sjap_013187 [Stephania japonica]|uniref:Uncharacterized protein n=1 Tax=Stephania japonica TaxID=461633 RepID=A0AAP0IYM9_9MAGN
MHAPPTTVSPAASDEGITGSQVAGTQRAPQRKGANPPPEHRIPITLIVNNTQLHPSHKCARRMSKVFKRGMIPGGYCWKLVHFRWDSTIHDLVHAAYDTKSEDFLAKSKQAFENRNTEMEGPGTGVSKHSSGSVFFVTANERLVHRAAPGRARRRSVTISEL